MDGSVVGVIEPIAEYHHLVRVGNDSGDVGNGEGGFVRKTDNTHVRTHRGERIDGDLWPSPGHRSQESAFTFKPKLQNKLDLPLSKRQW